MKKLIVVLLVLLALGAFLFWKFGPKIETPLTQQPVTLKYWGLWEEEALLKSVLVEFEKTHSNIKVSYQRQSSVNYRTRVQSQIESGAGPDVFMLHNSWTDMYYTRGDLSPAPIGVFTIQDYKNTFYPVVADSFIRKNQIYGAPMEIDGLAMFVNEELISGVGGQIPRSWQQFVDVATRATAISSNGKIQTSGAAMGLTGNVDHWSDLLGLLLLQQGVDLNASPLKLADPKAAEVLSFFTSFAKDPARKTWDKNMPSSTQAFAQNRLAFYFAPSWRAFDLRAMNPNLKFKVFPVPQLAGKNVAWASFWAQAVSAKSQHQAESWELVKFLTSAQATQALYQSAAKVRLFGQPYARVDLAQQLTQDPIVGAFITQGPIYKSWYLSSNTFDSGINDAMIKYFEDGVNATVGGQDPQAALQTVEKGAAQVLETFSKSPQGAK